MPVSVSLIRKLETVSPELGEVFLALVEEIEKSREEGVTKREFKELSEIVRELAEAQRRTEERVSELAEAQRRTEEEIRKLAGSLRRTREEVGGLSRSVAYALENEAFRQLPSFLKAEHGIDVLDRIVRAEIKGEEVNLLARAKKDAQEIILIGEAVLRLDDLSKLRKVEKKVKLVGEEFTEDVVPVIVTHFARKKVFEKAREAGFLVIQSFEW